MNNKSWKCLWEVIGTILLTLYLFAFYELILVPAILDWSAFGVGLALVLAGLLIWSIPADKRLPVSVLGISFLLAVKAINNIREFPFAKQVLGIIFIFLVLLLAGKLLGRFTLRRYLAAFFIALLLNTVVDPSQAPFWTEFRVKWESPLLYQKLTTVDYFPVTLADVDGDQIKEIITQENLRLAEKEQQDITVKGKKYRILEPENNYFTVYKWDGVTFRKRLPGQFSLDKLTIPLPVDYLGYPFYEISLQTNNVNEITQQMTPLVNRASLVEQAADFGRFPFKMLQLNEKSLTGMIKSQAVMTQFQPPYSLSAATGDIIPGPPDETVKIEDTLEVRTSDQVIGRLTGAQVPYLGISEVLAGDVDGDNTDEILLTAETARILKLSADGRWQTLWASPEILKDKTRFQHFRFEDFAPLGKDTTPQIIALAKSNVRENPTRYMTGYVYKDRALQQKWRVFSGLINLRAGDIDGDGQNELVGYMYRRHRVFVLEKHNLPVIPVLYAVTGGLILFGCGRQRRQKKSASPLLFITLMAISILFSGCTVKSGPRDFAKPELLQVKPADEAAEKLAAAFSTTARDGKKFFFTGWAVTKVQKRNAGFYINSGTYDQEKGYLIDASVFGQPFRYYRWGNDVYISEAEKWRKVSPTSAPLEPFTGFTRLQFPAGKAIRLPDGEVMSSKCEVYRISLDAGDAALESLGLKPAKDLTAAKPYLDRMKMKITLWIGKNDNFIYQYKTETTMPVPQAGSIYQEVFFKFWKYNNPGINLEPPKKKIEPYLLKD